MMESEWMRYSGGEESLKDDFVLTMHVLFGVGVFAKLDFGAQGEVCNAIFSIRLEIYTNIMSLMGCFVAECS